MSDSLTVLALDPSSTCCGYALGRVDVARRSVSSWIECGRFKPGRSGADFIERIDDICGSLSIELANWNDVKPDVVIVEAPKKPQRRSGKQSTGSMWVYGMAVGAVIGAVCASGIGPQTIELVDPADWAQGKGDKDNHKRLALSMCPAYALANDPGADTADAMLVLDWWASRVGLPKREKKRWKTTAETAENAGKKKAGGKKKARVA